MTDSDTETPTSAPEQEPEVAQDPNEAALARIRAERAAIQKRRQEREQSRVSNDELEAAKRELEHEQALEQFEEQFGPVGEKIAVVKTRLGNIILRASNHTKFRRFQDKESMSMDDLDALVRPCVLHPTLSEFDLILKELPATLPRCANSIAVLAGVRAEEVRSK